MSHYNLQPQSTNQNENKCRKKNKPQRIGSTNFYSRRTNFYCVSTASTIIGARHHYRATPYPTYQHKNQHPKDHNIYCQPQNNSKKIKSNNIRPLQINRMTKLKQKQFTTFFAITKPNYYCRSVCCSVYYTKTSTPNIATFFIISENICTNIRLKKSTCMAKYLQRKSASKNENIGRKKYQKKTLVQRLKNPRKRKVCATTATNSHRIAQPL